MAHAAIRRTNSEQGGSREVRAKPPHPRRVFMQQRPRAASGAGTPGPAADPNDRAQRDVDGGL